MTDQPRFEINGKEYPVVTDFTLGEICDAEDFFGVEFGEAKKSGVRMTAAILWISIKRVDDSVTPQDIRDLPLDVLRELGEKMSGDAGPPEQPASEPADAELNGHSGLDSDETSGVLEAGRSVTGSPG